MATTFSPLLKQFSWTDSTTAAGGGALPAGENLVSTTLGIRTDGDATHSPGNYQWLVVIPAPATTETLAQLTAALTAALPVGNYWANAMQTDATAAGSASSAWGTSETPFSIPSAPVAPAPPTGLAVS